MHSPRSIVRKIWKLSDICGLLDVMACSRVVIKNNDDLNCDLNRRLNNLNHVFNRTNLLW